MNGTDERFSGTFPLTAYPYTFAAWVNVDALPANFGPFFSYTTSAVSFNSAYIYSDGTFYCEACETIVGLSYATGAVGVVNRWYHVVASWPSATLRRIWVNGVLGTDSDSTSRAFPSAGTMYLGYQFVSTGAEMWGDCRVFMPAIWNVRLTDSEVRKLYRRAWPWQVRRENLAECWRYDGNKYIGIVKGNSLRPVNQPFTSPVKLPSFYPSDKRRWGRLNSAAAAAVLRQNPTVVNFAPTRAHSY